MAIQFYDIASKLDKLRIRSNPSKEDLSLLLQLLTSEQLIRYFFYELENPTWVVPLHTCNFFLEHVPDPKEDPENPGFYSQPIWYAGEYLKEMANDFPEIIRDVALKLNTNNARAIRTMLEAIIKTSPNIAAQTVDSFYRWSKTPFTASMMLAHEMGLVMEHLAKGGQVDEALQVLDIMIEPIPIPDRYDEGKIIAGTRHDLYWLNEAFTKNLPSLLEIGSIDVANILKERLVEAIDLEVDPRIPKEEYPSYSYWRWNIRPDVGRDQPRDFKDLLVNGLIQSLEKGCEQEREEIPEILSEYLDNPYVILKRIAVYVLRIKGEQYPELVEKAYRIWEAEDWSAGREEFEHFLDAQLGILPIQIQDEILKSIYQYIDGDEFKEWAEGVVERDRDGLSGITKKEKIESFAEEYEFRQLHRFARWLKGDLKKRYEYLSTKYEKPAPRPESGFVETSFEPERSPIGIDELGKKTVREVIQYLVDFKPEGDSFRMPSREGLGQVFRTEISNRLEEFVENSTLLVRDDLPFVYHENYLRALDESIKAGKQINIDKTIELLEYIVKTQEDKFEKQQYESGLPHAKLEVANLLEQFLRIGEPYAEEEMLDHIGEIILLLANEKDDPFIDREVDEQNPNELDTRTLNTNFDAATQSLNSIRGVAMHCLISYALYSERKRKADGGDKDKPIMVAFIKDALTEKLDKESDTCLAEYAVLGWYFPQLMYLDKEWSIDNLGRIFPLDEKFIQYWLAAWSAYIRFSDVYKNVFPYLINHYKVAIEILPMEKLHRFDRIDERLAEHLLKAYLLELIEIESEDELLKSYYKNSTDEVRSRGNFWLSQVLGNQKPGKDDKVWIRIWNIWQWRVAEASKAEDKENCKKEVTSFSRLLENTPDELDVLYPVLSKMIEFHDEDRFETINIVDYLAKNSEKHLKHTVNLLLNIIQRKQLPYLTDEDRNNIREIFENVKHSDNSVARQQTVKIINILGEGGDYEWREYLGDIE